MKQAFLVDSLVNEKTISKCKDKQTYSKNNCKIFIVNQKWICKYEDKPNPSTLKNKCKSLPEVKCSKMKNVTRV